MTPQAPTKNRMAITPNPLSEAAIGVRAVKMAEIKLLHKIEFQGPTISEINPAGKIKKK